MCAGDKEAGAILCARHNLKLGVSIEHLLRKQGIDPSFADDIFQDVWVALLERDHDGLKRYDPARGSLHNLLEKIAVRLIKKRYEAKGGCSKRTIPFPSGDVIDPRGNDSLVNAEVAEYLEDLTHQESRCLHEKLLNEPKPASEPPISANYERVLKHRLQEKLRDHLDIP
jgi:DNA-directed RNA polymerase specialized sigma24 family protein